MENREISKAPIVGILLLWVTFIIEASILAKDVWTEGLFWWIKGIVLFIVSLLLAVLFTAIIGSIADAAEKKYNTVKSSSVWVLGFSMIALVLSKVHNFISWTTVMIILAIIIVCIVGLYYYTRKKEPESGEHEVGEEGEPSWFSKNWPFVLAGVLVLNTVFAYLNDWLNGTTAALIAVIAILAGIYYWYTHRKEEPIDAGGEKRPEEDFWTGGKTLLVISAVVIAVLAGLWYFISWKVPAIILLIGLGYVGYIYFDDWKKYISVAVAGILILATLFSGPLAGIVKVEKAPTTTEAPSKVVPPAGEVQEETFTNESGTFLKVTTPDGTVTVYQTKEATPVVAVPKAPVQETFTNATGTYLRITDSKGTRVHKIAAAPAQPTSGNFERESITIVNTSETQAIEISGKPAVGFGFEYSGSPNTIMATFGANGAATFDGKNIKFNLTKESPSMDLSATNLTNLELNVAGSGCIFPGTPTTETMQLCRDLIDKLK